MIIKGRARSVNAGRQVLGKLKTTGGTTVITQAGEVESQDIVWTGTTSDATETEIFLGGETDSRYTLTASSTEILHCIAIAKDGTNTKTWEIKVTFVRDGSSNSSMVFQDIKILAEDTLDVSLVFEADDTNEAAIVKVTGIAATTISWKVTAWRTLLN